MLASKGFAVHGNGHFMPSQKRSRVSSTVAKAAGFLVLLLLGTKFVYLSFSQSRVSGQSVMRFRGHHIESLQERVSQIVDYQLNLSQAWRNPGEDK